MSATMKMIIAVLASFSCLAQSASSAPKSSGTRFGPRQCVKLARSPGGSCVLSTDCEGLDLSGTEFAFNCEARDGAVVRHSFGVGGFDAYEEFDTGVQCGRCGLAGAVPAAAGAARKPAARRKVEGAAKKSAAHAKAHAPSAKKARVEAVPASVHKSAVVKAARRSRVKAASSTQARTKFWPFSGGEKDKPEVVKYGPDGCVTVWRSENGHCIMRTDCAKIDISSYEFGLVCVDKVGSPVRHLFGKGSFDSEETFDTLIKCDQCLGLEDVPDEVALNGEVVTMSRDISNLKDVMKNISMNVQMLNEEVFKSAPGPAPAPASAPAAASLVHHATSHRRAGESQAAGRQNLRHRAQRVEYDDDEDDEDDEDDGRYDVSEEGGDGRYGVSKDEAKEDRSSESKVAAKTEAKAEAKAEAKDDRDDDDDDGED